MKEFMVASSSGSGEYAVWFVHISVAQGAVKTWESGGERAGLKKVCWGTGHCAQQREQQ